MVSAVPATENNFWIDRQKKINHGFVMGFERQKDRLTNIEADIEDLWGNFTGEDPLEFNDHWNSGLELGIVEFIQDQEDENRYLREEVTRLAYTNEKISQSMQFMSEQFGKIFETLKVLTQRQAQPQAAAGPSNYTQPLRSPRLTPQTGNFTGSGWKVTYWQTWPAL